MIEADTIAEQLDFFNPLHVQLHSFEGPLDLLLELIRKQKVSIEEVPLATICKPYLEFLDLMEELNLDVAGEFLVIASTLILIKSRALLPKPEPLLDEDGTDPEEALRLKLIEYQKFKKVSESLGNRELVGRDVFVRPELIDQENQSQKEKNLPQTQEVSIYTLIKAYQNVLKKKKKGTSHKIELDEHPIETRMLEILEIGQKTSQFSFHDLLSTYLITEITITFIALLELVKMNLMQLFQAKEFGTIHCVPIKENLEDAIAFLNSELYKMQ